MPTSYIYSINNWVIPVSAYVIATNGARPLTGTVLVRISNKFVEDALTIGDSVPLLWVAVIQIADKILRYLRPATSVVIFFYVGRVHQIFNLDREYVITSQNKYTFSKTFNPGRLRHYIVFYGI